LNKPTAKKVGASIDAGPRFIDPQRPVSTRYGPLQIWQSLLRRLLQSILRAEAALAMRGSGAASTA